MLTEKPHVVLRQSQTILGRFAAPFYSLLIILRYTISIMVTDAQHILCFYMTLLCGFPIPFNRLCAIFRHTFASAVTIA